MANNKKGPSLTEELGQHVSFLVELLPSIAQRGIARRFDKKLGTYAAANIPPRNQSIGLLTCPSSWTLRSAAGIPSTNYGGCHHSSEVQIAEDNNGVLFLNSRIALADIYDGMSNTMMIGEMLPLSDSLGWASGTRASLRNMSALEDRLTYDSLEAILPLPKTQVGGFGSFHPGSVNCALADGSCHSISFSMSPVIMSQLGDREDGEMMGNPFE